MFTRMMAKRGRNRSAKVERCLREAVCQPLEERRLLSTIYVDANSPGPTRNGTSWGNAYVDLQLALGAAVSGDTIRVADGTYKPTATTSRTISFQLKTGVGIYGGYVGYGAANPDARDVTAYPAVLSGDIGTIGSNTDNSYHVVVGSGTTATAVLDGFTITAGNANGLLPNSLGGGVYNSAGSPTITNCAFNGNVASSDGGGLYNASGSVPVLTNCIFSGNTASFGGGMSSLSSSPMLINCVFRGNSGSAGGAINNDFSSPTLINCTVSLNSSTGAGVIVNYSSSPTMANCIVWGNTNTVHLSILTDSANRRFG